MEWISVKDRLPEKGSVIITDGNRVTTGYAIDKSYYKRPPKENFRCPSSNFLATHWMPLPEPPKQ